MTADQPRAPKTPLSRRGFLRVCSAGGAGLALGFVLPDRSGFLSGVADARAAETPPGGPFAPNAWLSIDADGLVTVSVARTEMGQGVRTSLPMLVAEDLEADWTTIRVLAAPYDPKYGEQGTGGSTSVRTSWTILRTAGAAAREMLVTAAAETWGVAALDCRARSGRVTHPASGRSLSYGELAGRAAKLPVPIHPVLKDPKEFNILGRRLPRLDAPEKVNGHALFGIDVTLPGMLYASVARCPVIGGKLARFDESKARAVPGVRAVVPVGSGVAVVAETTWAARTGRDALSVTWDEGPNTGLSSETIRSRLEELAAGPGAAGLTQGDAPGALAAAPTRLEAVYEVPYLAHADMEPMNAVADVRRDRCEIWAPTQWPEYLMQAAKEVTGLKEDAIRINITLAGGGFGRRSMWDFGLQALLASQAAGAPVQVLWTREDDLQHDFYRPASRHLLRAALDLKGQLAAWSHRIVSPSITSQLAPGSISGGLDRDMIESAGFEYHIPNILLESVLADLPVPIGYWRSVYNTQGAFANECFLDEIGAVSGKDPLSFRRDHLSGAPRMQAVLDLAADKAGWGRPLPAGHGRGLACHGCFGSRVADVAEVSVSAAGELRVHRIVCAVDCGLVVNPDTVEAQMEGAIIFGLTAALRGEITLDHGRVTQKNFDDYPVLRLDEAPAIEVYIVPSQEPPGGIGEPGVPPVAPAVVNAIAAATGRRIRRLPIRGQDFGRG